jgi:hypothetical protein
LFPLNSAFAEDVEIVLPKSNAVYTDDTAAIRIAIPLYGCGGGTFPKKNWQGLFVYGANNSFIEDIELEIVKLYDFNGPNRMLIRFAGMRGKKCSDSGSCPVFFIANLKTILNPAVQLTPTTSYLDRFGEKSPDKITIDLNASKYVITIQSKTDASYGWQKIILQSDTISQVLYEGNEGLPSTLIWAGDINEDNKPDLLFRRPATEGGLSEQLWLSTKGSPVLKMIASFGYHGCH